MIVEIYLILNASGFFLPFNHILEYLDKHPSIALIVTISFAVFALFYNQFRENRKERKELYGRISKFCITILGDVKAINNSLKVNNETIIDNSNKIAFNPIILVTKIYDGFLSSGLNTYLRLSTQIDLDNLYGLIELRNHVAKERVLTISLASHNTHARIEYEKLLTRYENDLRPLVKKVQSGLLKEIENFK